MLVCNLDSKKESIFSVLLLALMVLTFTCRAEVVYAEASSLLKQKVVQTLLDSAENKKSIGELRPASIDFEQFRVQTSFQWETYSKEKETDHIGEQEIYRITLGKTRSPNLSRQWWKKIKNTQNSQIEIWKRPVSVAANNFTELLARQRKKNFVFELRMFSGDVNAGKKLLVKRFNSFLSNANANKLFSDEVLKQKPSSTKARFSFKPGQSLKKVDVAGSWKGPMSNSKGSKSSQSTLSLRTAPDGTIHGSWHAGWRVQNVHRQGNILSWKHNKLSKGCKDYSNRLEFVSSNQAILTYNVHDRCNKPNYYSGTAELTRTSTK